MLELLQNGAGVLLGLAQMKAEVGWVAGAESPREKSTRKMVVAVAELMSIAVSVSSAVYMSDREASVIPAIVTGYLLSKLLWIFQGLRPA